MADANGASIIIMRDLEVFCALFTNLDCAVHFTVNASFRKFDPKFAASIFNPYLIKGGGG